MNEIAKEKDLKLNKRLNGLLEYTHHVGKLNQKAVFKVNEYKQLNIWEHELKDKIGVECDFIDADGTPIWLKIPRLKKLTPSLPSDSIKEWISVTNQPAKCPSINEKIVLNIDKKEIEDFINRGIVFEDITQNDEKNARKLEITLEKNSKIKENIDKYIQQQWLPWSKKEKPRREIIKIYNALFSLQQTIETWGDEQPVELIWGIGICRWLYDGREIEYPILEKAIEIEIDKKDGAILILPRNSKPNLALDPFFVLENTGTDNLLNFFKDYYEKVPENLEFSPYIVDSYEPVLKQAATYLSESGIYCPNDKDKNILLKNNIGDTLEIINSWVIFARPRSSTSFLEDIKRFRMIVDSGFDANCMAPNPVKKLLSKLSDKKISDEENGKLVDVENFEPFFPKAYNDSQVEIIKRLEKSDGVVVQGPPGTGKTHTIANIICHYLATGRRVLVTSKGEPALSVLQNQIPKELRTLAISLLISEKEGMKQLEAAVELLSGMIGQTNTEELKEEANSNEIRVKYIKTEIDEIDKEIYQWGVKQLSLIDKKFTGINKDITAMDLAQLVVKDSDKYNWLKDKLELSENYMPKFSDEDIKTIKKAREKVGKYIIYIDKNIPGSKELIDNDTLVSIHNDLVTSEKIKKDLEKGDIPLLSISVEDAVDRARALVTPLQSIYELLSNFKNNTWLGIIFYQWIKGDSDIFWFEEIVNQLISLSEDRVKFVSTLVEIPEPFEEFKKVEEALIKLIDGKKAFGFFSFGNRKVKNIIEEVKIEGETPQNSEMWQIALDYIHFQDSVKKFIIKWNHASKEFDLPKLEYYYGSTLKEAQDLYKSLLKAKDISSLWTDISKEIAILFPQKVKVSEIISNKEYAQKMVEAIKLNVSNITLEANHTKIQKILDILETSNNDITSRLKEFIQNMVGNVNYNAKDIAQEYHGLILELDKVKSLKDNFKEITNISTTIADSGAPIWAKDLKTVPVYEEKDTLSPPNWFKAWRWVQFKNYLYSLDGRERLGELSKKREKLDNDLKRVFSNLVKIRTNIGLHTNMTESVQGALMRFVSSIAKIGKGTGKRAPRYQRDAYKAMQECYSGVPCWIMPTWRISESLPSSFGSFDLVVIDEASQSDITSLPAILRAKKILIVGDDKQVSPTAAFLAEEKILQLKQNFLKDQPFAELLLPGISLYDLASALFPGQRVMLTEHFRCVEPIIRFSMQFYNKPLIPLRIPKPSERIAPPLVDVYVKDGFRDEKRKINELEAEAIVSEIETLISQQKYKGRTIGVVSLVGIEQAKYIQDQILAEIGEDLYQEYQIACGDAATFQGKERDIVFLSMVVGASQGIVMNRREMEQRVNVALSRAKDRMYLYRSIQESDLNNETDLRLKILRHFSSPIPEDKKVKEYIELCETDFERDVYKTLFDKGYSVMPHIKIGAFTIDLVVEGDNDQRLAIELDGDRYQNIDSWMNDWKLQRTLERVGWRFWRCWCSSYTMDPRGCMDNLIFTLNDMKIFPSKQQHDHTSIYSEQRVYEKLEVKDGKDRYI